ncbi:hypothetical protein SAMN04487938_0282 [Lysobacter sp. cf310]|nr:hypothetical protein SAMN04487938_0282 [Lysobacter sp. cf310]
MAGRWGRWIVGAMLVVATSVVCATEPQVELHGWRVQQLLPKGDTGLGEPFKTFESEGHINRAYKLGDDAYFVISVLKDRPRYVDSLQLTGTRAATLPFKGLSLGDSSERVLAALGPPSAKREIESPRVTQWSYDDRNYSVEIDAAGRPYSIKLESDEHLLGFPKGEGDFWKEFRAAVLSGEFARIEPWLRPDVEVYRGGKTLWIDRRYRDYVSAPDAEMRQALVGDRRSLVSALRRFEPEQSVRLTDTMGIGMVFKFPADAELEELAFFPYAGSYRLYEAKFREGSEPVTHK